MNLKPVALFVSLAIGGALAAGCASQEDNKPASKTVTSENTPVEQPAPAQLASTSQPEELYPMIPISEPSPATTEVAQQDNSDNVIEEPEQSVFYFGFNKADVGDDDMETLKEHAEYLRSNPGLIVQIEGHTDFHGPRAYNEKLSKQRAEAIAKVLRDDGVPEAQLAINALGDIKPLECKGDTKHNRRVELHYKESHIASTQ